jgi:hypothetical protein
MRHIIVDNKIESPEKKKVSKTGLFDRTSVVSGNSNTPRRSTMAIKKGIQRL